MEKIRAPGNRTIILSDEERTIFKNKLLYPDKTALSVPAIMNKIICCDLFTILDALPEEFADLLIIDPPYNINKDFHGFQFTRTSDEEYLAYLQSWFAKIMKVLKPDGSVYVCGDWKSTFCLYQIMKEQSVLRNRIVWQREKGRGAQLNWKSTAEDIWFGTKGNNYYFNVDAVKQKRRVIASYKEDGRPKDWQETEEGNFRLTFPGNFWDDISVPYWSMPENTDHPAQKPEKLIAKLILASCPSGGIVLDPFVGSGTTAVVAKKLKRNYIGIELNEEYCCWAEKRLFIADTDANIQGYTDGVFWERNTANAQRVYKKKKG